MPVELRCFEMPIKYQYPNRELKRSVKHDSGNNTQDQSSRAADLDGGVVTWSAGALCSSGSRA